MKNEKNIKKEMEVKEEATVVAAEETGQKDLSKEIVEETERAIERRSDEMEETETAKDPKKVFNKAAVGIMLVTAAAIGMIVGTKTNKKKRNGFDEESPREDN